MTYQPPRASRATTSSSASKGKAHPVRRKFESCLARDTLGSFQGTQLQSTKTKSPAIEHKTRTNQPPPKPAVPTTSVQRSKALTKSLPITCVARPFRSQRANKEPTQARGTYQSLPVSRVARQTLSQRASKEQTNKRPSKRTQNKQEPISPPPPSLGSFGGMPSAPWLRGLSVHAMLNSMRAPDMQLACYLQPARFE